MMIFGAADPRYVIAHVAAYLVPPFGAAPVISRLYRALGFRVDSTASIAGPLRLTGDHGFRKKLEVGRNVMISSGVTINVDAPVTIGDRASIGPFVKIYTASHQIGPASRRMMPCPVGRPVLIGSGAWIGLSATILPGVTVGPGSIVAAGSVVHSDVPPNTYVEGNPARVKKTLPWPDR